MPKEEQQPLLGQNKHSSYGINQQQSSINDSNSNSTESLNSSTSQDTIITFEENEWIDSISRYQGQTQKKMDDNGNWQYETSIIHTNEVLTTIINESFIEIDGNKYWQKATHNQNNTIVVVELLNINFSKKTIESYTKTFKDDDEYISDTLNLATFQKKERNLSLENQFLEGVTIKAITGIDNFITYTKSLNEQLTLFNENPNNDNLNILLKLYKYLTVIQNFIDGSKSTVDTSINAKFNKILKTTSTSILGLIQIYIGLTGKNLQRIVSNFPIDGKDHTLQDYTNAIFWNWENYAMVLLDTALGIFFTAAASNWSRDIIFNKQNEINPFAIKQFNADEFEKYQDRIETLLYEENDQELNKHASSIIAINNLMQKFDEIENCSQSEFEYHPNFRKETEHIKAVVNSQVAATNEVKEIVSSANKAIKQFEKPIAKPLTWKQKGYYILNDLTLELSTWALSNTMISGASANTTHDDFTIHDWPTYIIKQGALVANVSRYIVMRPINNIFKSGLTNLGIPTNICPKKISQWVAKQSRNAKLEMVIPLFFFITILTNIVKTEAALVSEVGINNSWQALKGKLAKGLTWLFFSLTTFSDMVTFAVSDFYKIFSQFNIKTITNTLTNCCKLNKEETTLLEKNLIKLEKNGKLPTFNEEFTKYQELEERDSGIEENLSQRLENSTPRPASDDETFTENDDRYQFNSNMINNQTQPATNYYQPNSQFNMV